MITYLDKESNINMFHTLPWARIRRPRKEEKMIVRYQGSLQSLVSLSELSDLKLWILRHARSQIEPWQPEILQRKK